MDQTGDPRHVIGLDLVRFWAAATVMLYHLGFWSWASPGDLPYRAAGGSVRFEGLVPFSWFGWCGVETFFVISGFVICASATRATPYRFLRSRVGRLYPTVWVCATVTAVVSLVIGLASPSELVAAYIRSLAIFPVGPWIDSVYRTLIVEGVFYLLVLLLLLVRGFQRVERVAMLLGVYSVAFWIVTPLVNVTMLGPVALLNFSKYGIFFALGMMLWVIDGRGISRWRAASVAVLTCFGALEIYLVALGIAPDVQDKPVFVPVLVWLASVVAIMLAITCNAKLCRLLSHRTALVKFVGLLTYPLYLLHDIVGSAMLRTSGLIGQATALGVGLLVSLALACLVVRIEPHVRRPLLAGLDRMADRLQDIRHNVLSSRAPDQPRSPT